MKTFLLRSLLISLACAIMALPACKTLEQHQSSAKIFTQYAVAKYLEKSGTGQGDVALQKRADHVRAVCNDLRSVVSSDGVTVPFLKMKAAAEIAKLTTSPADRLLATNLLDAISAELTARIGDGLLSPDQIVQVSAVLDWVVEAVNAVSPPVTV